eukprot:g7233.t1
MVFSPWVVQRRYRPVKTKESDTETKPVVTFRLSVGSEKAAKQLKPRGPNICGLPSGQDDWDFGKAVDEKTQTFVVCLEILSDAQ